MAAKKTTRKKVKTTAKKAKPRAKAKPVKKPTKAKRSRKNDAVEFVSDLVHQGARAQAFVDSQTKVLIKELHELDKKHLHIGKKLEAVKKEALKIFKSKVKKLKSKMKPAKKVARKKTTKGK